MKIYEGKYVTSYASAIESKKPLYTNFKDTISEGEIVNFEELVETDESEKVLEEIKNICLRSNKNLTLEKLKKSTSYWKRFKPTRRISG